MYPVIAQAAGLLGSVAIRNVATIGGNLANAAPSADTAPALVGLSARAKIVGPNGERLIPLKDLFAGPGETVLTTGELLVEIQVPVPLPGTNGVYLKHSRSTVDLAVVGVAAIMVLGKDNVCTDIKIVLGAVAPTPIIARTAEEILVGKRVDKALIKKSAQAAAYEAKPIADLRASAEYRREVTRVLAMRAIKEAMARCLRCGFR